MALIYGTKTSTTDDGEVRFTIDRDGMSQEIFLEMEEMMSPPLQKVIDEAPDEEAKDKAEATLEQARHGWEKLAFAVAKGVTEHIKSNMEIRGVQSSIRASADVEATTGSATATGSGHEHGIDVDGILDDVIFDQRPSTGRAK